MQSDSASGAGEISDALAAAAHRAVPSLTQSQEPYPFRAVVDLGAIAANVTRLRELAGPAQVMAVVKANGYGHGLLPAAAAARAGGAQWLGVAFVQEGLDIRAAGDTGPIFAWMLTPGDDFVRAVQAEIDVSVNAPWMLARALAAAAATNRPARIHLKVDTGLNRNGCDPSQWAQLCEMTTGAAATGLVEVIGIWTHLASADVADEPSVPEQLANYEQALKVAAEYGVKPQLRHVVNSSGTCWLPQAHYDLVRPGLAVYGLSPASDRASAADLGLRPAMTLTADVSNVKRVPAGARVSYRHTYETEQETTLAVVSMGYADGLPVAASNRGQVYVGSGVHRIAGRVCMDQIVVNVGDDEVAPGDEAIIFGDGSIGEPTVEDWAEAAGTIPYEIITRLGQRVKLEYVGTIPGVLEDPQ